MSTLQWKIYIHTHLKYISSSSFSCGTLCICKWLPQGITIIQTMPKKKKKEVFPVRKKILATMHFFWANLFDKMWYLFLNKYLFCLYREFSSGNNFIVIIRTKKIEKTQMVQRIFRWYIRTNWFTFNTRNLLRWFVRVIQFVRKGGIWKWLWAIAASW